MLLQTDLIGKLTAMGYHVAIVSQNALDENFRQYYENPLVTLVEWQEKSTIWDDDYLYKRMYFLEDLGKNTALKEKFYNALFYSKSKHPWKRIRPLYYYLIYQLIKVFPQIRERFMKKESKHLNSEEAKHILDRLKPRTLISTYPVSIIEAKMLHAAKEEKAHTLLHLLSWDNISCKGKFPVLADEFIAWGQVMYDELKAYYEVSDERISICGVPHFDEHVRVAKEQGHHQAVESLGLNPNKPYLFFAMSSPRFAPKEIDIVEWLAQSIETDLLGKDLQLIVRPHPQNVTEFTARQSWLERLKKLDTDRVKVDFPKLVESKIRWSMKKEDMVQLSSLLAGCNVCLNSGSTVSIDALMHQKPVIITSFDGAVKLPYWNSARRLKDYAHLHRFISQGGAVTVGSYDAMTREIKAYLDNPEKDFEQRENALLNACYKADGLSTQRVTEAIDRTLKRLGKSK